MSRQRSRQDKASKPALSQHPAPANSDPLPAWASTRRTVIYAILGLICSGIFFHRITREDSMLGGIMGWELEKFSNSGKKPGQKSWTDLGDEYRREAAQMPGYREHEAMKGLLYVVAYVHRGRIDPGRTLDKAKSWAADDPNNLVSRMTLAYLIDKSQAGATGSIAQRLDAAKTTIDGTSKATRATLHQDAFNEKWHEVLRRYIKREDVAISAARHIRVEEHEQIAALPVIVSWLNDLSASLRRENKNAEAEQCDAWIKQSMLGIIDAEPDSGTRLLALDLLSKSLPSNSSAAKSAARARLDFHSKADHSPIDLVDIYKTPAMEGWSKGVSFVYVRNWFTKSFYYAAIIIGILLGLVVGTLSVPARRLFLNDTDSYPTINGKLLWPVIAVSLLALSCASMPNLYERGLVSQSATVVSAILVVGATALILIGISICFSKPHSHVWAIVLFLTGLGMLILTQIPVSRFLPLLRSIDLTMSSIVFAMGFVLLILCIGVALNSLSTRTLWAIGSRLLLVTALIGIDTQWNLLDSDRHAWGQLREARFDEFPARLGPDWQSKYLSELANSKPTTQP